MKIPYKIRLFDRFVKQPKYIVIHDVSCMAASSAKVRLDNANPQTNDLRTIEYTQQMQPDLNYHFIVEKIKEDYEVLLGRPMAVHCDYDDIPTPYNFAFHVCLMGNYNYDIPDVRFYKKICYNILAPMMKLYKINPNRIYLHSELTTTEAECPGEFFDKQRLLNYLKSMRIL